MTAKWGIDCFVGLDDGTWADKSSTQKIEMLRSTMLDVRSGFWRHFNELRDRVVRLEHQQHGTHSRHEDPTYREAKAFELIVKLEERVEALERTAVKRDMVRGMDFEQVHPDEMARLRRIERAARDLVDSRAVSLAMDGTEKQTVPGPALRRLREALGDA